MVRPTFIVYDSKQTFEKHCLYNGNPLSRIPITKIWLPENGAFWFFTEITNRIEPINTSSYYVHLYPQSPSVSKIEFNNDPLNVTGEMLKYNPETKNLEVKTSIWWWKKPLWTKNCIYYGKTLEKSTSALGEWLYDPYTETVYIMLSS